MFLLRQKKKKTFADTKPQKEKKNALQEKVGIESFSVGRFFVIVSSCERKSASHSVCTLLVIEHRHFSRIQNSMAEIFNIKKKSKVFCYRAKTEMKINNLTKTIEIN